jgi:hypothetical protein
VVHQIKNAVRLNTGSASVQDAHEPCRACCMPRPSKDRDAVSLAVRTHSAHGREPGGWAAFVLLSGPPSVPRILLRGRMQLCDSNVEGSNQPFHRPAAMFPFHRLKPMDFKTGEAFVNRCRTSSQDLALRALRKIIASHGALSACCVLTGPERPLPPLRATLASHGLMHAAEREFFREVVRDAAARLGIATEMVKEKDLPALAKRLPGTEASRRATLGAFGKQVGRPWAQDEKLAAVPAWFGLAGVSGRG